jgi:hypothetical protein
MTDITLHNTDQDDITVIVWDLNQAPLDNPPIIQPEVRLD